MAAVTILRISPPKQDSRCDGTCMEEREVEYRLGGEPARSVITHLSRNTYSVRHGDASTRAATARAVEREISENSGVDCVIVTAGDFLAKS